jgi:pyridoxine 4-dehydrogenase
MTPSNPSMRTLPFSSLVAILLAFPEQSSAYVTDVTKVGSLTVPNVGIGTIAWSSNSLTKLENPDLDALVESACQQNGGFFDTGERYGSHIKTAMGMGWGETESMIAKMLQNADVQDDALRPTVATKFTPSPWRTSAKSVVEACEASRERLGVDSIDLYQIHMPDIVKPLRFLGKDESYDELYWDGLAECYHRGLVKNVGVSNYGPTLVTKCHDALAKRGVPLASNQIAYSLIGRHNGAQQTVDRCNELGVKVLAYYPFAMGLLTGKYSSLSPEMATEDVVTSLSSSRRSKLELKDLQRYANGDGKQIPGGGISPLLRAMEAIANARGKTVAQVALNYIICKGALPIAGARTADQVSDNLGSLGWRLSEDEVALLEYEADSLGINFDGAGFKKTSEKFVGYGMEKWALN